MTIRKTIAPAGSFLRRLRRDTCGNTSMLVAAALFPLLGMMGGALDMSRAYLVKARLQHACDAAVLAGRRSMSGVTWTSASEATADNFFNANFTPGRYGSQNLVMDYDVGTDAVVHGTATVDVPTSVMKMFGKQNIALEVKCDAELQLPNTDVMFVLDTTLSMNDTNAGDTQSKIAILRSSVSSFHAILENAKAAGTQVRYGFVPYSSTVNVGMLLKREWMVDNWTYDSRVEAEKTVKEGGTQAATITTTTTTKVSGSTSTVKTPGPSERCVAPANTLSDTYTVWTAWSPNSTALPRTRERTRTRNGSTFAASLSSAGVCTITETKYDNLIEKQLQKVDVNPDAGEENADSWNYFWDYQPVEYSIAPFKGAAANGLMAGGSFVAMVENNHKVTGRNISWAAANACIEERKTRRTNEATTVPMYDMDVDLIPVAGNDDTRWRPYLPGVVFGRSNTAFTATAGWTATDAAPTHTITNFATPYSAATTYGACPTGARKLGEITATQLTTYVNSLKPAGYTYHDIGFVWGLRLMSAQGLFAAENIAAPNGGSIARHLIFMTDGDTDTRVGSYDAWGMSGVARRRTNKNAIPTDAAQNTITEDRLSQLCTLAKNDKNITVWVIAFGTSLTANLSSCASPNRAYQADNAEELAETFAEIASQIAQLRLTQ